MASLAYDPFATSGRSTQVFTKTLIYLILAAFAFYYLLPLAVVITNSFRELDDISGNGLIGVPRTFSLQYWPAAWSTFCLGGTCEGIAPNFYNSLYMTIPATIISTALGAINGYILSKWRFRGHNWVFGAMTIGVFLPGQMSLLPWAYTLGQLGLTNTIAGLVFIHTVR